MWLGTAAPGDTIGNFPTALEQLSQRSIHFYEENGQYWFDTQASVQKTANEYAEQLREDPETVYAEVQRRLQREFASQRGDFAAVHVAPETGADVPDTMETRLVVVHPRHTWRRNDRDKSSAHTWIMGALAGPGAQRIHKNTLVFAAADYDAMDRLEAATRQYLGWRRVSDSADSLDLSAQQSRQAKEKADQVDALVAALLRESYVWAVFPVQDDPREPLALSASKITGSGPIATAITEKLRREEALIPLLDASYLGHVLSQELKSVWEQDGEVSVKTLWEWFTKFPYMLRLKNRQVLDDAVAGAPLSVSPTFAVARGKGPDGSYVGLIIPPDNNAHFTVTDNTLLVSLEKARNQVEAEEAARGRGAAEPGGTIANDSTGVGDSGSGPTGPVDNTRTHPGDNAVALSPQPGPRRYWASIELEASGFSKQLISINTEVLDHLRTAGARLSVRLEIEAEADQEFDSSVRRTVSENSANLRFRSYGFDE